MSWGAIIAKGASDTANNFGPQIAGDTKRHWALNVFDPAGLFGGAEATSDGQMNFTPVFKQGNQFLKYLFGDGQATGFVKGLAKGDFAGGLFGPGARDAIRSYMNGTTIGAGGPNLLDTILGGAEGIRSNLDSTYGFFDQSLNTLSQFNETGLPTDGTAYFNEAIRRLRNEAIPNAAETAGLGVQSSGFANASAQASEDLLGQASLANIDLAEAATNRRLAAAPALATVAGAKQAFGPNLALLLHGLYSEEQGRPLNVFNQIMNMAASQNYGTPSYNPYDSSAQSIAAGGAGLAGIFDALSNFDFGNGGGMTDSGAHQEFVDSLFSLGGQGY